MSSADELRSLPAMTAAEKLERFTPEMKRARAKMFGSRASLSSTASADSIKKKPILDWGQHSLQEMSTTETTWTS